MPCNIIEPERESRYVSCVDLEQQSSDFYLQRCLELAQKAAALQEVPVGALIVHQGEILAEAYNLRETEQSPLGHAEIRVISEASAKLGRWRLADCTLYVSLEPCVMCSGAIIQARIPQVVYGTPDPKGGGQSLFGLLDHPQLNHRCEWALASGPLSEACGLVLKAFFQKKRQAQKEG